jgi:hypothetical protein
VPRAAVPAPLDALSRLEQAFVADVVLIADVLSASGGDYNTAGAARCMCVVGGVMCMAQRCDCAISGCRSAIWALHAYRYALRRHRYVDNTLL